MTPRRSLTYRRFSADPLSLFTVFLAAGLLAVIAGILGMHVMNGSHSTHASGAARLGVAAPLGVTAAVGHSHTGNADAGRASAHPEAVSSCAGSPHDVEESGALCIPSVKTGSLTVFPPHETGLSRPCSIDARSGPATAYAYAPPGPTPCELSISRT